MKSKRMDHAGKRFKDRQWKESESLADVSSFFDLEAIDEETLLIYRAALHEKASYVVLFCHMRLFFVLHSETFLGWFRKF